MIIQLIRGNLPDDSVYRALVVDFNREVASIIEPKFLKNYLKKQPKIFFKEKPSKLWDYDFSLREGSS